MKKCKLVLIIVLICYIISNAQALEFKTFSNYSYDPDEEHQKSVSEKFQPTEFTKYYNLETLIKIQQILTGIDINSNNLSLRINQKADLQEIIRILGIISSQRTLPNLESENYNNANFLETKLGLDATKNLNEITNPETNQYELFYGPSLRALFPEYYVLIREKIEAIKQKSADGFSLIESVRTIFKIQKKIDDPNDGFDYLKYITDFKIIDIQTPIKDGNIALKRWNYVINELSNLLNEKLNKGEFSEVYLINNKLYYSLYDEETGIIVTEGYFAIIQQDDNQIQIFNSKALIELKEGEKLRDYSNLIDIGKFKHLIGNIDYDFRNSNDINFLPMDESLFNKIKPALLNAII